MSKNSNRILNVSFKVFAAVVILAAGLFLGWGLTRKSPHGPTQETGTDVVQDKIYTCPMHPTVKLKDPKARCPICFMALVELKTDQTTEDEKDTVLSESAVKLLDIQTRPVERKFVTRKVILQGKIEYNETKVSNITAWVPGRIDRLFVDYTGMPVKKGFHMVRIYSPDLLTAQEELLQTHKTLKATSADQGDLMRETARTNYESSREKLRLLGLSQDQIDDIIKTAKASEHVTLNSPIDGIVTARHVNVGQYVKTGERIYSLADLSQVWGIFDAYESDIQWIRYGQELTFTVDAYPQKEFKGKVVFISPVMDEKTQTISIRVNIPNPDSLLAVGMFVEGRINSRLAAGGKVMEASLKGKWICPMHPEIVSDKKTTCTICQMDLVTAESMGFKAAGKTTAPLIVPASAVLQTGKRAVVYVKLPDKDKPTFALKKIELGPRSNGYFIVKSGLKEGQQVVSRGAFKIDSERQLKGLPSMMAEEPPKKKVPSCHGGHHHE